MKTVFKAITGAIPVVILAGGVALAPGALAASSTPGVGMSGPSSSTFNVAAGTTRIFNYQVYSTGPAETAKITVTGSYASTSVTSVTLPAGGAKASIPVTVNVPTGAPAGTYSGNVKAQVNTDPAAGITLSPGVSMNFKTVVSAPVVSQTVRQQGNAVKSSPFSSTTGGNTNTLIAVTNTGNVTLEGVTLHATSPVGTVTVQNVGTVAPGKIGYGRVSVNIPRGTAAGTYTVNVTSTGTANGTSSTGSTTWTFTLPD